MELLFIVLPAFSTLAAAVAAWFSFLTSKASLDFQKQFAKNRNLINRLELSITKLRTINSILSNTLSVSDELFTSTDFLMDEIIVELHAYIERGLLGKSDLNRDKLKNTVYLNNLIAQLESAVDSFF